MRTRTTGSRDDAAHLGRTASDGGVVVLLMLGILPVRDHAAAILGRIGIRDSARIGTSGRFVFEIADAVLEPAEFTEEFR